MTSDHNSMLKDMESNIRHALEVLLGPVQVVEVRALDVSRPGFLRLHTESGYFNDPEKLLAAVVDLTGHARGVYVTINPVSPSLLARAHNRIRAPDREPLTSDGDILRRWWLLIDIDPVRPSGISSSDEEHEAAIAKAKEIRDFISAMGWPDPVLADSGNGAHLLYRIDIPADDGGLVKRVLEVLARIFDDDLVKIDEKVFNPARIVRLYGTLVRKGDSTEDRPHRFSRLLEVPENVKVVPIELLEELANSEIAIDYESLIPRTLESGFNLERWISEHRLDVYGPRDWNGGRKWIFRECPWNADHRDASAYIVELPNGAISAGCHHNGCTDNDWHALRDVVEPNWRESRRQTASISPVDALTESPSMFSDGASVERRSEILDGGPQIIRRPLSLVGDHAYVVTRIWTKTTRTRKSSDSSGDVGHALLSAENTEALVIVRDDGRLFTDGEIPDALPVSELGLDVRLPEMPPGDRLWSGAGLKRYISGGRVSPAELFGRLKESIERFIDFHKSLADSDTMCEMVACYVFATYLLDAFPVIGYLWPNGERGCGKTTLLIIVGETAYLGQVILAGGSYATLRDLADAGATLAFDDAEAIMDVKRTDPDKRALLLAGNRKGATITVKEPSGKNGWTTRHVHAYCPRLFSAIRLPDEVLASRTITIPLVRSSDSDKANADPFDVTTWPHDPRRLRDDLWSMGLSSLAGMPAYDREAAVQAYLNGRDLQPWRAILAVALWLTREHGIDGLFDRMNELSVTYQSERKDLEGADPTRLTITALLDLLKERRGQILVFGTSELTDRVNELAIETDVASLGEEFTNPRRMGWLLKRLRFNPETSTRNGRRWRATASEIEALAKSYSIILPEPEVRKAEVIPEKLQITGIERRGIPDNPEMRDVPRYMDFYDTVEEVEPAT